MSTRIEELEAYNRAGIGIVALTLDIRLRQLSVGFENQWICGPALEPLDDWSDEDVAHNGLARDRIEDYVTTCVGGSAGVFLYNLAQRRHIQRSQGDAGLQMKHLRQMCQCAEPESDRAFAIAFALLGKTDDGDTEGTMLRL